MPWALHKGRMTMIKGAEITEGLGITKLRNPIRINDSVRNYRPFSSKQKLVLRKTVA